MHFIFSINQDSSKIFSEAPDPKLTEAKEKLSMDFNRRIIFLAIIGKSGAITFELSPVFTSFSA